MTKTYSSPEYCETDLWSKTLKLADQLLFPVSLGKGHYESSTSSTTSFWSYLLPFSAPSTEGGMLGSATTDDIFSIREAALFCVMEEEVGVGPSGHCPSLTQSSTD